LRRSGVLMIVHLVDGTYELFRHFYGQRRANDGNDKPFGAVAGVLNTILEMVEGGATHLGVATDHVIESFRNRLWAGYKTGNGIERALASQFKPLEAGLAAMGITVWPMIEYEADDALASAALAAAADKRVEKVCIWTPDKDLAQCVQGDRIVQIDRRSKTIRNEAGVHEKFGVMPNLIPDFLALVGDSADGFPGIKGIGPVTAVRLLKRYGALENFPEGALGRQRAQALLFKDLAKLRTDVQTFADVDDLLWEGPQETFAKFAAKTKDAGLHQRSLRARELMR
jgi:5'-3' exonuclease